MRYIFGVFGIEGRYPFLDPAVVQAFLSFEVPRLEELQGQGRRSHPFWSGMTMPFEPDVKRGFLPTDDRIDSSLGWSLQEDGRGDNASCSRWELDVALRIFRANENPGARPGFLHRSGSRPSTRPKPACDGSAGATCHCTNDGGSSVSNRAADAGVRVGGAPADVRPARSLPGYLLPRSRPQMGRRVRRECRFAFGVAACAATGRVKTLDGRHRLQG